MTALPPTVNEGQELLIAWSGALRGVREADSDIQLAYSHTPRGKYAPCPIFPT